MAVLTFVIALVIGVHQFGDASRAQDSLDPGAKVNTEGRGSVTITPEQRRFIRVATVEAHPFGSRLEAVGIIDFNEDRAAQVSTPYAGRILQTYARAGDDVAQGKTLFTLESPDLVQAESTLVGASAALELSEHVLARAKSLAPNQGIPQKELEQAQSAQQTAEANYQSARDALRIYGKTDADMARIVSTRQVDRDMPVPSPLTGRVTQRNAAVGTLVQPGMSPAPYVVADISTMWMLASVPESQVTGIHVGQPLEARVAAFPGRTFVGHVTNVGASVDTATRRVTVRSEVADPKHELRSQMTASFVIKSGQSDRSPGVPAAALVRESDGSISIWVTADGSSFTRRTVRLGMTEAGLTQVLDGVKPGEQIATEGALWLSNAITLANP